MQINFTICFVCYFFSQSSFRKDQFHVFFYLVFNIFNDPVFARSDKPHYFSLFLFALAGVGSCSWLKIFGSKDHGDIPSRRSTAIFDCNHVSKFTRKLTQKLSKRLNALRHSL